MPAIFTTVGQHEDDPDRLLLLGEDGRHYQYDLHQDRTTPIEPPDDSWRVDPDLPPADELLS